MARASNYRRYRRECGRVIYCERLRRARIYKEERGRRVEAIAADIATNVAAGATGRALSPVSTVECVVATPRSRMAWLACRLSNVFLPALEGQCAIGGST